MAVLRNASCRVHLYSCPPALRLPSRLSISNLHGLVSRTADELLAVANPPCSLKRCTTSPPPGRMVLRRAGEVVRAATSSKSRRYPLCIDLAAPPRGVTLRNPAATLVRNQGCSSNISTGGTGGTTTLKSATEPGFIIAWYLFTGTLRTHFIPPRYCRASTRKSHGHNLLERSCLWDSTLFSASPIRCRLQPPRRAACDD